MIARPQQETMLPPQGEPSPAAESACPVPPPAPAEPEVIDGEVTLELPAEPDATSPAAGQRGTHGEITVDVPPEQEAPAPRPPRPYALLVVVTGVICLAVLLAHLFLPAFLAPPATVTIIPMSRALVTVTTLSLQGRPLGPLTLAQAARVPATGHRHQDAQPARGAMTFFNGLLTAQTIAAGTVLTGSSGVQVVTERAAFIPAGNPPVYGEVTVPAHALLPGPRGNLRAGDIHQACCAPSVVAENLAAFTGGQDARDDMVVTRADLDTAATTLKASLNTVEHGALAAQVNGEEALLSPPCQARLTSDHRVGDPATSLQVTITAICRGLASPRHAIEEAAQQALAQQAARQLERGYTLSGTIQVTVLQATITDQVPGVATIQVQAEATYAYQLSQQEVRSIRHLLAGASRQQALSDLLQLPGIQSATVSAATLPADPDTIQIVILYQEQEREGVHVQSHAACSTRHAGFAALR